MRPQRLQPTRLPSPWDFPGKNTGVGCHFLLQCMKVKSESDIAQSCPTLSDPMDRSLPGSSTYGIFQARVLEWGAVAFSECKARGWQRPVSQLKIVRLEEIASYPAFLFYSGLWLNGWGLLTLGRTMFMPQFTQFSIYKYLIQKHSQRHPPEWCLNIYLDISQPTKADT